MGYMCLTQFWFPQGICLGVGLLGHQSVQFSSVAQSCLTLCDPMNHSTPGLQVHHQLLEFTKTRVHWVGDAIQFSAIPFSSCPQSFPASGSYGGLIPSFLRNLHNVERLLLNHMKTLRFLAPSGEEFNPGPETRLDCSELLCNKVSLKYKGDRERFWHRHQKWVERVPAC